MRTLEEMLETLGASCNRDTLESYITRTWVRPIQGERGLYFEEIDIARVRLIQQLRHDMQVGDEAMDVVLLLLDQMYSLRARVRRLTAAIDRQPEHVRAHIVSLLEETIVQSEKE